MSTGERGNYQGKLFQQTCKLILEKLGYTELDSGSRFNLDSIQEPPINKPVLRPKFSPNGVTAFEFKSGLEYNENEIKKLSKKIPATNKDFNTMGGVIISDLRIKESNYREAFASNIFLWDVRDMCFLSSKINLFSELSLKGSVREEELSEDVTFLWSIHKISSDPFKKFSTGDLVILFHNPFVEINLRYIKIIMENIKKIILEKCKEIPIFPLKLGISIHSRGFINEDVKSRQFESVLNNLSDEELTSYSLKNMFTYYIAPWESFLLRI
jgi:hypothetical protein